MSIETMKSATFESLKGYKIELRRKGLKGGVRYANVTFVMKRRFGRD